MQAFAQRGDQVRVLSRKPDRLTDLPAGVSAASYDHDLADCDVLINLAGAGIADKRWNPAYKDVMRSSRVDTTELLVRKLVAAVKTRPGHTPVLINASAIGYYGDGKDALLTESSPRGAGFLPELCEQWEAAALPAQEPGVRTVLMRIGLVLSPEGGALKSILPPFRFFVGGKLASGRQWMSWIHLRDQVRLFLHCADNGDVAGPVNAVAPNPVTNADFSRMLARVLGRPCWAPVPGFMLKLILGEFAQFLVTGARVSPDAALASGFAFEFPELEGALRDLLD